MIILTKIHTRNQGLGGFTDSKQYSKSLFCLSHPTLLNMSSHHILHFILLLSIHFSFPSSHPTLPSSTSCSTPPLFILLSSHRLCLSFSHHKVTPQDPKIQQLMQFLFSFCSFFLHPHHLIRDLSLSLRFSSGSSTHSFIISYLFWSSSHVLPSRLSLFLSFDEIQYMKINKIKPSLLIIMMRMMMMQEQEENWDKKEEGTSQEENRSKSNNRKMKKEDGKKIHHEEILHFFPSVPFLISYFPESPLRTRKVIFLTSPIL